MRVLNDEFTHHRELLAEEKTNALDNAAAVRRILAELLLRITLHADTKGLELAREIKKLSVKVDDVKDGHEAVVLLVSQRDDLDADEDLLIVGGGHRDDSAFSDDSAFTSIVIVAYFLVMRGQTDELGGDENVDVLTDDFVTLPVEGLGELLVGVGDYTLHDAVTTGELRMSTRKHFLALEENMCGQAG